MFAAFASGSVVATHETQNRFAHISTAPVTLITAMKDNGALDSISRFITTRSWSFKEIPASTAFATCLWTAVLPCISELSGVRCRSRIFWSDLLQLGCVWQRCRGFTQAYEY